MYCVFHRVKTRTLFVRGVNVAFVLLTLTTGTFQMHLFDLKLWGKKEGIYVFVAYHRSRSNLESTTFIRLILILSLDK